MQVALDPPVTHVEMESFGDFAFVLAQKWTYERYRKWYKEQRPNRDLVMIDHGAYEIGRPIQHEQFWSVIRDIYRSYRTVVVILPDVPQRCKVTRDLVLKFLALYPEVRQFHLMYVLQSYRYVRDEVKFAKRIGATYIGVPIWMDRVFDRWLVLQKLLEYRNEFQIHLLGLDDPSELLWIGVLADSVDTSLPFTYAKYNARIDRTPAILRKTFRRIADFELLTEEQKALARYNIEQLLLIANAYQRGYVSLPGA